jgi:hypothetical protein
MTDDSTQTLHLTVRRVRLKRWRVVLVVTRLAVPFDIDEGLPVVTMMPL